MPLRRGRGGKKSRKTARSTEGVWLVVEDPVDGGVGVRHAGGDGGLSLCVPSLRRNFRTQELCFDMRALRKRRRAFQRTERPSFRLERRSFSDETRAQSRPFRQVGERERERESFVGYIYIYIARDSGVKRGRQRRRSRKWRRFARSRARRPPALCCTRGARRLERTPAAGLERTPAAAAAATRVVAAAQ